MSPTALTRLSRYISGHLREKLEINPAEPRYLKVVWAQGYKLVGE